MARTKTPIEKEFNLFAKNYGHKSFEAQDFDTNEKLQKALQSFEKSKTFELKDDFSNLSEYSNYHHDFLSSKINYLDDTNLYEDSEIILYTQKLFKIASYPVAKIFACECYHEIFSHGANHVIDENGNECHDFEINSKIDKFHDVCIKINNAKKFIESHFPRWSKFTELQKKEAIESIELLKKSLPILGIDIKPINVTLRLMTNYKLNQTRKFKSDFLLSQNLPNITNSEISKKIVHSLIFPYL